MSKLPTLVRKQVVPARSRVAVNKSLINMSERQSRIQEEAKRKAKAEEEIYSGVFAQNMEIALALLPSVPFKCNLLLQQAKMYSSSVRKWIAVLSDSSVRSKTHSHLSYLVLQMQNMKISDPFNKDPPENLTEGPKSISNAKFKAMDVEMANKNKRDLLREGLTPHGIASFRKEFKPPIDFFDDQIVPCNGLVAYGGCFSNHFY